MNCVEGFFVDDRFLRVRYDLPLGFIVFNAFMNLVADDTALWNRELFRKQIKSYYANPTLMAITAIVNAVAPGLLSLLLSLGVKVMGLVMGLSALCFAVFYALTTLNHKDYSKEENQNESCYR